MKKFITAAAIIIIATTTASAAATTTASTVATSTTTCPMAQQSVKGWELEGWSMYLPNTYSAAIWFSWFVANQENQTQENQIELASHTVKKAPRPQSVRGAFSKERSVIQVKANGLDLKGNNVVYIATFRKK